MHRQNSDQDRYRYQDEQEASGNSDRSFHSSQVSSSRASGSGWSSPELSQEPSWKKWSDSLHNLLGDRTGYNLFLDFLKYENAAGTLLFYTFCTALKANQLRQTRADMVDMMYRTFVQQRNLPQEVLEKLVPTFQNPNWITDFEIFDQAQQEAFNYLDRELYHKFLEDESYLNYINSDQVPEDESSSYGESSEDRPNEQESEDLGALPIQQQPIINHQLSLSPNTPKSLLKSMDSGVGGSTPHTPLRSFLLPTPTPSMPFQQSQHFSNPAQFQPSWAIRPPRPVLSEQPSSTGMLQQAYSGKMVPLKMPPKGPSALTADTRNFPKGATMALTKEALQVSLPYRAAENQKQISGDNEKIGQPYHSKRMVIASAKDSEVQSFLSDNSQQRRPETQGNKDNLDWAKAKTLAKKNREENPLPQPTSRFLKVQEDVKTSEMDPRKMPPPADFATQLIQKLEKFAVGKETTPLAAMIHSNTAQLPDPVDESENILDDHCNRIWKDKTPESANSLCASPQPSARKGPMLLNSSSSGAPQLFVQPTSGFPRSFSGPSLLRPTGPMEQASKAGHGGLLFPQDRSPKINPAFPRAEFRTMHPPTASFKDAPSRYHGWTEPPKQFPPSSSSNISHSSNHFPNPKLINQNDTYLTDSGVGLNFSTHPYRKLKVPNDPNPVNAREPHSSGTSSKTLQRLTSTTSSTRRHGTTAPVAQDSRTSSRHAHSNSTHTPNVQQAHESSTKISGYSKSHTRSRSTGRKQAANTAGTEESVTVLYRVEEAGDYFMTKLIGKNNLRNFKSILPSTISRGDKVRYFFRKHLPGVGVVFEELNNDHDVLPLYENRITATIEPDKDKSG